MLHKTLRAGCGALVCLICLTAPWQTAQAGRRPLITLPYEIGDARSLPWNGPEWRDVKSDYELNRLVDDTLALLTPGTPVLVRMETLRRAAIYSAWARYDQETKFTVKDDKVSTALLARLLERAQAAERKGALNATDALALFDAGYFVQVLNEATATQADRAKLPKVDGYALVVKASGLRQHDAAMEFAAALMNFANRSVQNEHLQKALAGAPAGSLLARNLVKHFDERGRNLAELRASVGAPPQ